MPVGNKVKGLKPFVLKPYPILQYAHIMTNMQFTRRSAATYYSQNETPPKTFYNKVSIVTILPQKAPFLWYNPRVFY
jgi:hypothetical protein